MQACAAEAGMCHLHNIMQHATNLGVIPWQSVIYSLIVEAICRDKVGNFHEHEFLGKVLNRLLVMNHLSED